ncbi:hypothetical protein GF336_04700 [Candidatus Woesearchaeota archaeon]|nr:hypothetical protein [Candidatus Woesearchaeota archaeon]
MTKTFTLDNYLKDDSRFKIGLEFERTDEEIKEEIEDSENPVSPLNAIFFGYTLIGINGQYPLGNSKEGKERYAIDSHPLVHFDSLITTLEDKLTPEPDYDYFLENAKSLFFDFPKDDEKKYRFYDCYQIGRDTGVGLNLAIISPDEEDISLIWYDSKINDICHDEVSKDVFKKKIVDLTKKIDSYFKKLNVDKLGTYQRLVYLSKQN